MTENPYAEDTTRRAWDEGYGVGFDTAVSQFCDELLARVHERYRALVEAAREMAPCELHCGRAATPDVPTYCFSHHEDFPCSGEYVRRALAALES